MRRSLGDESYTIRFTPRKPTSNWSLVNVAKVEELKQRGLMAPAGLRAFAQRSPERTGVYSIRAQASAVLPTSSRGASAPTTAAWEWFRVPRRRATAAPPPTG